MKRFLSFFLLIVIVLTCVYAECSFDKIKSDVVRLHVIANSNTKEDQELKLKVRDSILVKTNELLKDVNTKQNSLTILKENLCMLENTAYDCIQKEGYSYSVAVFLGEYDFPTKTYDTMTLPRGTYDALRIVIGEGKGDNWWCVLFPPFCLDKTNDPETESKKNDVVVKFKLLEIYNSIKKKINSIF